MRFVIGEKNKTLLVHVVDDAGPEVTVLNSISAPNELSCQKTMCGQHYGSDALAEKPEHVSSCPDCEGA